jgi:hypothetical protein
MRSNPAADGDERTAHARAVVVLFEPRTASD